MAVQTLCAEWRAGGSKDHDQRDLHAWPLRFCRVEYGRKARQYELQPSQSLHPCGQRLLVGSAGGMSGVDAAAVDFGAVLADLEFALDAGDGDGEADDAGEHSAEESVGEAAPLSCVARLVGIDEAG